jgi:hypothetical protein
LNRSSRDIPGLRGTPAGITTTLTPWGEASRESVGKPDTCGWRQKGREAWGRHRRKLGGEGHFGCIEKSDAPSAGDGERRG